jgi:hypothetical protein
VFYVKRVFIATGLVDWAIPGLQEKEETKLNKETDTDEGESV